MKMLIQFYFLSVFYLILFKGFFIFGQPIEKSVHYIDTFYFNYQADTAFHNRIQQVPTKLLFGVPTSSHIRFESHGLPGPFKLYYTKPKDSIFEHIVLNKGPKSISGHQPYTIHELPDSKGKLLFYHSYIVWVDKENHYIRKWNHIREAKNSKLFTYSHTSFFNDFVIDSTLFFDICIKPDARKKILKRSNSEVSPYAAFACVSISDLFKCRNLNYKRLKYISSDECSNNFESDFWKSIIFTDSVHKDLWYSSHNSEHLLRYSLRDNSIQCYALQPPIPPGLDYLKSFSTLQRNRFFQRMLKYHNEDTVQQASIVYSKLYRLPNENKIMVVYALYVNEDTGDTVVLSDLHKHTLISGEHWTELSPSKAIFQVFQMFTISSHLELDWQVMVPLEHSMNLLSATESSITGINSVPKDGYFVPALITWHLK